MEHFKAVVSPYSYSNNAERAVVNLLVDLLKNPVDMTIEQVRDLAIKYAAQFSYTGSVTVRELWRSSCYVGAEHIQKRAFGIVGRGRKMAKLVIYETIDKDANNSFQVADSPKMP